MISRRQILGGLVAGGALAGCAGGQVLSAGFPTLAGRLTLPKAPLLDPDTVLTRIGIGSCFNQNRSGALLETAMRTRPQLFLFMGDDVYGDTQSPDLDELVAAYAAALARPDYRRFRESVPMAAVWDDHDFGLNDGGATYAYKAQSQPLFFDFWGVAAGDARRQTGGIYDSFVTGPAGRRVQTIMLDTRSFRDDWRATDDFGAAGRERYIEDADPSRNILGAAQWEWLEAQLRVPAEVRIIVTSYQLVADGHGWECWRLFPAERQRFYDLLARTRANGVLLVSGDRHRAGIYRQARGLPYPLYELTSSAINMGSRGAHTEEAGPNRLGPSFSADNVGMVTLDWATARIGLRIFDRDDRTVLSHDIDMSALRG